SAIPSASRRSRSSSWSLIEPAAADEPKSERPKRAPSSSAQLTSRTVSGGVPSSAIRRSTSTAASRLRQPSSQPPFGTESMCPPISSARSEEPRNVNHWLPASSISSTAPVPASFCRRKSRAVSHVSVHATRWAPFSSPVSSRRSSRSATARAGSSAMNAILKRDRRIEMSHAATATLPGKRAYGRQAATGATRALSVVAVVATLVGFYELYRWIWSSTGWTYPFVVDDTSMPHVWVILHALWQPAQVNQPALGTILFHKSLFTAKEAAVGFGLGAMIGFAIGIVLAHSRLLVRGFLPYIVAS